MKKVITTALVLMCISASSFAQKFAYVDMDYILSKLPQYQEAQKQLDKIAEGWQKEIEQKMKTVDDLYKQFQAEQVLMTEQMKQQKMQAIEAKEKEVKEFQKSKFGANGELFKKRQELVKPIQDKIYNEIQKYASAKALDFIFDKSSGPTMLFASEKFNKSDDILSALGISANNNTFNKTDTSTKPATGGTDAGKGTAPANSGGRAPASSSAPTDGKQQDAPPSRELKAVPK